MIPYKNEAFKTYARVSNGLESYKPNQLYHNTAEGVVFYINERGYLHSLMREGKDLVDVLLTKDNMLKHSRTLFYGETAEEIKTKIKEYLTTAIEF